MSAPLTACRARFFSNLLSAYLDQFETEGPVVITRNGRAVAVLLAPMNDEDLETLLLARSPRFQALLARLRDSIREGKGLSSKEFWKSVASRNRKKAVRK